MESFQELFSIISSYRKFELIKFIYKSGIAEIVSNYKSKSAETICKQMNWNLAYGIRFLEAMIVLGLLIKQDNFYTPSEFFKKYFFKSSKQYLGSTVLFESFLQDSWKSLDETLQYGKRIFNEQEKLESEYKDDLLRYISSMDEVARIRSEELWSILEFEQEGSILEVGAGSGAYLKSFARKFPNWELHYFDIHDVTEIAKDKLKDINVYFHEGNILEDNIKSDTLFNIILFSNFAHCYSSLDLGRIIGEISKHLSESGVVLVHDFYKDTEEGLVYDLHMMLNTFSGQTYSIAEMKALFAEHGFHLKQTEFLKSGSIVLVFGK